MTALPISHPDAEPPPDDEPRAPMKLEDPPAPQVAVAVRAPAALVIPLEHHVREIATRGHVTRYELDVRLPRHLQYAITAWEKKTGEPSGVVVREGDFMRQIITSVGITSAGYDHLNRWAGVQVYWPEFVHDEHGNRVLNPIHRPDYFYLRGRAIWWNDVGQMMLYQEDIEVDYGLMYREARISHKDASVEPILDPEGDPVYGADGNPLFHVKLPMDAEKAALKSLYNRRSYGSRYAYTVARVRLLKAALGVKTLPLDQPKDVLVKVIGYRDDLTGEERIQQAEADAQALYGTGIDRERARAAASEDLAAVELEGDDDVVMPSNVRAVGQDEEPTEPTR